MREMSSKESEPMYSREEILGMVAGRELDHLVSTHVMQIESQWRHWFVGATRYYDFMDANLQVIPDYSTDIAAAWEVVEKFPIFEVRRIEVFEGNITYEAEVWADLEEGVEPIEFTAKSAPEVICKAALLSLLKED